jgi:hypothetical protein
MTASPFFLPWVGTQYASGINGQRLLVLGESHYSDDSRNAYPQLTRDIVARVVGGERFPFFTKIGSVIERSTKPTTFSWQAVLFYNFVQQLVGAHARDRPTEAMWASGFDPLMAVLTEHRPSAVLVAGVGTWGGLSRYFPRDAQSQATASGEDVRIWKFAGQAPMAAAWIDHPASFGFRPEAWTERVSCLFTEASRLTQPGHD